MIAPPTDSLYKFIAIAGIVMVLWGAAFPWNKAHEYELQSVELKGQISAVGQKARLLQVQYDGLEEKREALKPDSVDFEIEKQAITNQKMKLYLQLMEAQNPVDLKSEKLKVLDQAQSTYRKIGWASMVIGIVFTFFGFVAWYFKIQRYLDRDLAQSNNGNT